MYINCFRLIPLSGAIPDGWFHRYVFILEEKKRSKFYGSGSIAWALEKINQRLETLVLKVFSGVMTLRRYYTQLFVKTLRNFPDMLFAYFTRLSMRSLKWYGCVVKAL